MIPRTPVERVANALLQAGFQRISTPLEIAGLHFDVPVAFVGKTPSPDLVVVADTILNDDQRLLRIVEGIARAMDVTRSRRPLTTILAGPRPRAAVLDSMSRVCRVLPIGTVAEDNADAVLHNWLAVLLPLQLPMASNAIGDPLEELAMQLKGLDPEVAALAKLAVQGQGAVQKRFHEVVAASLNDEASRSAP